MYINCLEYLLHGDNILKFTIRSLDSLISLFMNTYCDHHCSLSNDTFEFVVLTQRSSFMLQLLRCCSYRAQDYIK